MPPELESKVDRWRDQARGAVDHFNWKCINPDGQWTVRTLVQAVEEMRIAVPADAYVNMSGPGLFASWQREVG